jgi:AraC-like DNA-binding protein
MLVKSSLHSSRRVFYDLSVNDGYDSSETLKVTDYQSGPGTGINVANNAHYMSGFYLIDDTFSSLTEESVDFQIQGDCLAIVIFYDGQCSVRDRQTNKMQSYEAGMIRLLSFEDSSWELLLSAGQKVSYLSIIISRQFLSKITRTENWAFSGNTENAGIKCNFFRGNRLVFINQEIKGILHHLLNPAYSAQYLRAYFELKVRELLFLIHMQSEHEIETKLVSLPIYNKLIAARAYLTENYVDSPTIDQLARVVSLNEFSLKTQFKALFGTTIHRFITRLRMEYASQMLLEDRFVADVAAATGYQSVSHFISVYKKYFGKTPKQAQFTTFRK